MAATKTAKKTSQNDTPNTPEVSESKIARMKVGELRRELKSRGVKGTDDLKKPDLVNKLIKAELRSAKSGRKKPAGRNETPNTPEVSESKIARMKVAELRTGLAQRGVKGTADMKKAELVERFVKAELKSVKNNKGGSKSAKASKTTRTSKTDKSAKTAKASGGKRTGKNTASSLQYSQEITSTADRPERAGRSLVTTDHEVIRQWAKSRRAVPATVPGTEHDGHLGVLRLDFPGYSGDRLVEVSWAEWFEAFDKRRLNFIYQERRSGGERSNFFQLENPDE
jgi:predicted HTH domain antitoxin